MIRSRLAFGAVVLTAISSGCGGTSTTIEPWRASHPDPAGISFDETAPGLCAFPVQYPDQAPAAIEYQGATYVQSARTSAESSPPGSVIGRSADWTVTSAGGDVYLIAGPSMYQYRPETNC
ncbi:MAG: hypothetical protein JOY80_00430 [Candidatus Dormibacteraeota bacterium]|nr:hypothetical protein [Candidatus Dormibacteraeota bacterium]